MDVHELRPGLWRWTSRHPDWEPDEGLPRDVGSVYYQTPDAVTLVDPLVPEADEDRFWRGLDEDVERGGRPVTILLTVPWHERSAARIAERYGGAIAPEPPPGIEAIRIQGAGGEPETIFWLPEPGALVVGDIVVGAGAGMVRIAESWLPEERRGEPIRADLRPLLDLHVQLVLVSHGEPVYERGRAALEHALRA